MHRRHDLRCQLELKQPAPLACDAKRRAKSARAAVEPRQTSTPGLTTRNSASSQGRQAAIWRELGFWWMRRFPRGSHLKCLTGFVT